MRPIRKFSPKKRLAARLSAKRMINNKLKLKMPRGYGWIRNPKKWLYNKIYYRSTVDIVKIIKKLLK